MGSGLGGGWWRKCRALPTPQHLVRAILALGANGSTRVDGLPWGGIRGCEKRTAGGASCGENEGVPGEGFWRVALVVGWKSLPGVLEGYLPIGGVLGSGMFGVGGGV